jgi:hypothetical protein
MRFNCVSLTLCSILAIVALMFLNSHKAHAFEHQSNHAQEEKAATPSTVAQWSLVELAFFASMDHSWRSFPMKITFTNGTTSIELDAFWYEKRQWKVHFTPPTPGKWTYRTSSNDPELNGKTGEIISVAPTANQIQSNPNYRGQLKISSNGRYFIYTDGTPLLILADCLLLGSVPAKGDNFRNFLQNRKEKGFNGLNVRLAKPAQRNEGGSPYIGRSVDQLNFKYFIWVDKYMKQMWEAGFVCAFFPDFLGHHNKYSMQDVKDISRYLLARYSAFNILYIITGEFDNFRRTDAFWKNVENWKEVGNYVKAINDKGLNVPIGIHPLDSTGISIHKEEWLDYNQIQAKLWRLFNKLPWYALQDYKRTPPKPIFYAEGVYENQYWDKMTATDLHVRHQTWVGFLCGATALDYGETHIKGGNDWERYLNDPGAYQVGNAAQLLRKFEWWNMVPRREWILVNGKVPELVEDTRTHLPYCLADQGKAYITYIMMGLANAKLTMTNLQNKTYKATWYDPRKNLYIPINNGNAISGHNGEWTIPTRPSPADEDWVLLLTSTEIATSLTQSR